ncbi:hypothetical protein [Streptomyces sp. HUAS TT20]|uniref:hypothetical protein n=1 Tax=Streptomyces sp. HUAS TT20 TaxID=3447509 RepID=UPI0021D83FC6|nr:hypothetical protein [Streptomyces sp. HUAS 15-9]UXY27749.1 hypothetical protein N8I87_14960 [Streptomyces sp. HUAS 15-9]
MVSSAHEAMHQIFREDPGLLARALPRAGIPFPEPTAIQPLDTDLTEIRPLARRVDTLFRVDTADDGGFLLAIESQGKPDPDKLSSWTYYLAHLYAKYQLPPVLLVVCRDKATASWAAEPVRVGPPVHTSMVVFPLVLGPGNVPAVTDPDEAADDLALAVFSALAHAKDPGLPAILDALAAAVNDTGGETAQGWAEFTELGLGETPARQLWRNLMTAYTSRFPGRGTLIEETLMEGLVAGRAESRAEDILRILDRRGIEVPEAVRERVTACADLDILGTWFDRALTVVSAEELFAEA